MSNLKVTWRNGVAWATGRIAGERIRKSLGTREREKAKELCALYEAKLWKRNAYGEDAVRTFEEAAISYMEAGGERLHLPPLIRLFSGRVLGSIKPGEITAAAKRLYPELKGSSLNRIVVTPARAVINHAAELGWCGPIKVKSFPVERVRRQAVGREWIDAFMAEADRARAPHLSALVLFMWSTGTRVSEALRVMPEHVDVHARTVMLERTKESEWEVRHLTTEMTLRIANLRPRPGGPIFGYAKRTGASQRMLKICAAAGIAYLPPHQAGRHSYATNALKAGATIPEVMEGGGWKSARLMLETYAHAETGGRRVADLLEGGPGHDLDTAKNSKGSKPRLV